MSFKYYLNNISVRRISVPTVAVLSVSLVKHRLITIVDFVKNYPTHFINGNCITSTGKWTPNHYDLKTLVNFNLKLNVTRTETSSKAIPSLKSALPTSVAITTYKF